MLCQKRLNHWHELEAPEADRSRDPQPACQLLLAAPERSFGLRDLRDQAPRLVEIVFTFFGQCKRTRGSRQQPRAQLALERRDLFAHRALCRVGLVRDRGKAARFHHAHESLHGLQLIHFAQYIPVWN
jgi:hypothetical protein